MTEILIILAKLIASSASLYAFYWFVLRNRATYRLARLYLLLMPFVSLSMSGLTLKVLPSSLTPSPSPIEEESVRTQVQTLQQIQVHELPASGQPDHAIEADEATTPLVPWREVDGEVLFLLVWGGVAFVLVVIALYHIIYIHLQGRRMKKMTTVEGYTLVYSPKVPAPCSFGRTIFMPTGITDSQRDLMLRHEKAHIRHGHYIDVWLMELMTRLLWFNPVLWLCRNELRNVHEFEADHDVLTGGADIGAYQTLILEQVMVGSPIYTSGLTHSFIRRRFVEMKRSTAGTLSLMGKLSMLLWVVLLFCGFTFARQDTSTESRASVPELSEPQPFTIMGLVDGANAYANYNLYLADDYMQIQDDRLVACENVVDGKFRFRLQLTKMTAGRVRGVAGDGSLSPTWTDFFLVPGDSVELRVYSDFFQLVPTVSYMRKTMRGINALRNATGWQSPHLPKVEGRKWEAVTCQSMGFPELTVKEVIFGKDETVLRIFGDDLATDMAIRKATCLTDDKGGKYWLRRALFGSLDEKCSPEARVYGGYYAFDPVPDDVEELNLMTIEKHHDSIADGFTIESGDTIWIQSSAIFHIKEAPKPVHHDPNFKVDITVSQGIGDSGYLINLYNSPYDRKQIADIATANRKASFATYVGEPQQGELIATFPDGSICTHCMRFPFVPGEHAEVKVMNGSFFLTGSTFYKQWSDADELEENARKYRKEEETQALLLGYLKEHASEEGCVMRYWQYEILPHETILAIIPDKVKNGRFKNMLE